MRVVPIRRFSGDPGRWPTGVFAEKHERQPRRRPESDFRVEVKLDEDASKLRLCEKQNRAVEREPEKRGQTAR